MAVNEQAAATEIGRFGDVDATGEAERFIAFLEHIESLPLSVETRERSYALLQPQRDDAVVDVGCGTGKAVAELTARGATASGIDVSERMIALARRRFPAGDFRVAAAEDLPFAGGTLQGYRAERVYQHLHDPAVALAEARRVLAAGGRIVLIDQDYDMWAVDSADPATTRALARAFADSITHPWIGRQYRGLLLDAGFTDVAIEIKPLTFTSYADAAPGLMGAAEAAVASNAVTREQADAWLAEQRQRDEQGRFFMAMALFLASARKG
jgi:ubiquinone/menaquinone biosynthesis C-methylase UbiE